MYLVCFVGASGVVHSINKPLSLKERLDCKSLHQATQHNIAGSGSFESAETWHPVVLLRCSVNLTFSVQLQQVFKFPFSEPIPNCLPFSPVKVFVVQCPGFARTHAHTEKAVAHVRNV